MRLDQNSIGARSQNFSTLQTLSAANSKQPIQKIPKIATSNAKQVEDRLTLSKQYQESCKTCDNRRYQDESNDTGVSFQSPQNISPEASGSVVMGHEREHFSREQSKATNENKEVIAQAIRVYTSICTGCNKTYVAGGETTTTVKSKPQERSAKLNLTA